MMKQKVIIVLPKLTAGGTERTAAELANYLVNQDIEVHILLMYKEPIFFNIDKRVKIIEPNNKLRKNLGKVLYVPYLLWFLRYSIKKINPNSILILGYILFGLIATLNLKGKVFISNRASPERVRFPKSLALNKLYALLYKMTQSRVDGVIAQTKLAAFYNKKKYNCPIKVIPNFLKEMRLNSSIKKENIIITIGRAVPEKGQKYFVELVKVLSDKNNDWRYVMLGDGPQLPEIKDYAFKLGIYDKIEFLGFYKDVDELLSKSKIFILTSVSEGYPNAIIESMAHGCVPVSFNCVAGPADIISHGKNGFLVDVADVSKMSSYVQSLIDNEDLLLGLSNKALNVNKTNSSKKLCADYMEFILN